MTNLATFTIAGQGDIRQRLTNDGLAALGLTSPLLAPAWTAVVPTANAAALSFTVTALWYAPIAGMLVPVTDGRVPGLSLLDGTPAANGGGPVAILKIHPQARLRLERLFVLALEAGGATPPDRSLRPVPATILVRTPSTVLPDTAQELAAADLTMPGGVVTFHDERGLIVDPFAFAAQAAALIGNTNTAAAGAAMPSGSPLGTLAAIALLATAGKFFHVVDLHGRPWHDPGNGKGLGLYAVPANSPAGRVGDGTVMPWANNTVLAPEGDPTDTVRPRAADTVRVGWSTFGTIDTAAIAWPVAGAATPTRDTLRVAAVDLSFHLLGNRTATPRDDAGAADPVTIAEQAPQVRDGSPVTLHADGRGVLGSFGQVILQVVQGGNPNAAITTGPLLAAGMALDNEQWPLPADPTPAGRWPANPAATVVGAPIGQVMQQLSTMRAGAMAQWIQGGTNVLVTLPNTLPNGVFVRIYPIEVLPGTSPDEQPLLRRHDGGGAFVQNGATILLNDPLQVTSRPASPTLRADAAVTWLPAPGAAPMTVMIGSLAWSIVGEAPAPAAAPANLLSFPFYRSICSAPVIGAPSRGNFNLGIVIADPVQFVQTVVRQLSTDQNPRESPRLPTMARTENLLAVQVLANADPFRGALTGGWLSREADTHTYKSANPGGASNSEVHAPGVSASSQLGFDLWVAAMHRSRPVVPTLDIANLPGLPNNWVLLQTSAASNPPNPPAVPSSMAGALLQSVPAFVETPELALTPDDDVNAVTTWVQNAIGNFLSTGNDAEIQRQLVREVRSSKYGRRDAQWALRRALRHARELVYIETPLLAHTSHGPGAPAQAAAAVDLITELQTRLGEEPGLRVVILIPRDFSFPTAFTPWAMRFYDERNTVAQALQQTAGTIGGRQRVVVAHPMGIPGRPLVIRTTTVIVDDVWCMVGTSSISRRGLTFDGGIDMVLTDRTLDRGAGSSIRAYRKSLMASHLGLNASGVNVPPGQLVQLHQQSSAHAVFADVLANGGEGKLLPLWAGPDPKAPGATIPHPLDVADPDGRGGGSLVNTIAAALAGNGGV